ncbi:hypothetical protein DL546_001435 [Coniochaeta pulveracea]|uniref:Uncharacterized protein n=1 Tax=Coniochaeta pulveracea TaxID=177199 RepID=A0A420Y8R1_9PEZI|nr:hypothetical protein DL546_001435 [Coniochaeta pulveracea]
METINNLAKTAVNTANSAVNAVWGSSEEPVSGKQGNVAAGEPYDAGNIEPKESTSTGLASTVDKVVPTELGSKIGLGRDSQQQQTSHHEHGISSGVTGPEKFIEQSQPVRENTGYDNATGSIPKSTSTSHHTSSGLSSGVTGSERVIAETQPARENTGYDNSGAQTSETALRPKKVSSVDTPSYDNDSSSYERTTTYEGEPRFGYGSSTDRSSSARENVSSFRDEDNASSSLGNAGYEGSGPHKEFGSSTGPTDQSKGQQDIRSPDDAQTHPQVSHKRDNVDDADGGVDADTNPEKVKGPGPRPVAEVAKEHGGDAGKATGNEKVAAADDEDDGDGPQKTSHGEGTGEKYVKTSGLAADGGDFDATKPGAGREADRLLETKGVHRDVSDPNKPAAVDKSAGTSGHEEHKEKTSLKDKIKDKLHRHGH